MKRYLSNFKLTENFILESMLECLPHKTKNIVRWNRKDTSYFLADYYGVTTDYLLGRSDERN